MVKKSKKNAHLLVEGHNDLHVISHLCQAHKVAETFDILTPRKSGRVASGDVQVLQNLRVQLLAKGKKAIGVVLDADDNLASRWQQVSQIMAKFGYVVPPQPDATGTIISAPYEHQAQVGIWLMPNNQTEGNLEDFIRSLIPPHDQLQPYADDVLDRIEAAGLNKYKYKRSKAFIHTWLAWQKEPAKPLGQAITARYLDANAPYAQQLIAWIRRVFQLTAKDD